MDIEKEIKDLLPQMRKDKEFLWNHPEEEFKEIETSAYLIKRLRQMGYTDIQTNIAQTGIVAELQGNQEGECILFRAEMDAVTMEQKHHHSCMRHACGHDAHMTILLALAKLLMDHKDSIKGHVKLVFQPAEEGSGGAKPMIAQGVLENPHVDKVFALHVWSELEDGKVGIKEGSVMAATNPFTMTVIGKGGHAAIPEKCINPIYIASAITMELQQLVDKEVDPHETAVVGITAMQGGSTNNVIADQANLKGICRTYNNVLQQELVGKINKVATKIAKEMNGDVKIDYILEYPATVNSAKEAKIVQEIAEKVVGQENLVTDYQSMCADDFAFFLQERPGAFVLIGNQGENTASQHSQDYWVSEKAMIIGSQIIYEIAKTYLFQ